MLIVDLLIYINQKADLLKDIIPCYPLVNAYTQKDLPRAINQIQTFKINYHEK